VAQGGGLRSPGTVFCVCVCNLILMFCFSITASGFGSKYKYLFGHITMQIKLVAGNSAGTVTAYYVSNMPRARLSFCHCVLSWFYDVEYGLSELEMLPAHANVSMKWLMFLANTISWKILSTLRNRSVIVCRTIR
jgi:hypothetical protein